MKGLLPNEFPFSRKRKPARRKAAVQAPAAQNAAPDGATLSAPIVELAPQPETIVTAVTTAETAPVIAIAAEAAPTVPTAPATVAVEVQATVTPAAPVAVAAPVAAVTPAIAAPSSTTHQDPRRATSRASVTPATATATTAAAPTATTAATEIARLAQAAATVTAEYKGPERRRSPRQSLRAKATYRSDLNPAGAGPVQILNFSMCGVRLWSNRAMKLGDRGNVKMEIGPVKWFGRVKVVTCDHDDEGYSLGCEFASNEVARRSVA
jgi:hypothetical protein